jgi:hypothetical protein
MEIAFSEGRKIIDFCIDSQIPREDAWILNTTSKFLYAKVGSRHMPEAAEDIDPNAVRTHLLNQRIFSLTNRGAVERHGLDSYLGTAGYKKHCPAPTDQIKEAVYIVSSTFYHFYPLLQKRYLDIQKKENY